MTTQQASLICAVEGHEWSTSVYHRGGRGSESVTITGCKHCPLRVGDDL